MKKLKDYNQKQTMVENGQNGTEWTTTYKVALLAKWKNEEKRKIKRRGT